MIKKHALRVSELIGYCDIGAVFTFTNIPHWQTTTVALCFRASFALIFPSPAPTKPWARVRNASVRSLVVAVECEGGRDMSFNELVPKHVWCSLGIYSKM